MMLGNIETERQRGRAVGFGTKQKGISIKDTVARYTAPPSVHRHRENSCFFRSEAHMQIIIIVFLRQIKSSGRRRAVHAFRNRW